MPLLNNPIGMIDIPLINEASDEDLIEELNSRGVMGFSIKRFTDTELNAEISRRRKIIEKRYDDLQNVSRSREE